MTTDELIRALRDVRATAYEEALCNEAADRLEELDERVAIMSEECGGCVHWDGDMCRNARSSQYMRDVDDGCNHKEILEEMRLR